MNPSDVDGLTGLATLPRLRGHVERAIARARRFDCKVGVVLLDLERFGRVNEQFGHDVGDGVMQEAAKRLQATIREYDSVGRAAAPGVETEDDAVSRLGGDKFVLVLEGLTEPRDAARVVERVFAQLALPMQVGDDVVSLSARTGIAVYPEDGLEATDLLKAAEGAIHHPDEPSSTERIRFFSREIAARHRDEMDLERCLRESIEREDINLAYQPRVSLSKRHAGSFEALLRYQHPERGPIPPPVIISLAERTGLINDLGAAIFRRVCRDAIWLRKETGMSPRLFTNFSPRQLESPDWSGMVQGIIDETKVDPHWVGMEITESVLLDDSEGLVRWLDRFAALGIEIALDDFGTGYSHLGYLPRLPLHEIKIDRSFVVDMVDETSKSREVAALVVILGRSLGLQVVAEGAETEEQVDLLHAMGCHSIQGYWFARPAPLETFFESVRLGRIVPAGAAVSSEG